MELKWWKDVSMRDGRREKRVDEREGEHSRSDETSRGLVQVRRMYGMKQ